MESGVGALGAPDAAGGLIVMVRPDPARAARSLASELGARLAIGGRACEAALAGLADRRRHHHDLDALGAAMRRAEHTREATRAEIAGRVSTALNTHVAIHPNTLRRAATEYEASLLALDQAVARDARRARWANVGRGAAAATAVLAAAALVLADQTTAGLVVAGAAVVLIALWASRAARPPSGDHEGLVGHVALARSRWEQVAGPGADPTDLDAIVRRYDPQDSVVADLVGQNPAVRAAERVALERRMAWVSAWRIEVGDHAPITDPDAAELLQHARAQLWLAGSPSLARTDPETLILASPYADLPTERARELHRRLLAAPRTLRVIIVLAPDASTTAAGRDQVATASGWTPGDLGAGSVR